MDEKTISITEKVIGDTLYIVESEVSSAAKETAYDVVRHINLGSIRHFKLVENNIKQFTQHINLCFFCALF